MEKLFESYNTIFILGPTACGKTPMAVRLAHECNAEIISADSRQVYRGLDLGSGKDLNEYTFTTGEGENHIPYHLIDVADLSQEYSVFNYQQDFYRIFPSIVERDKNVVVCGGTGMYLDAVLRGYDLVEVPTNFELRKELEGSSMEALAAYLQRLKGDLHNDTDITERHRLLRAIEIEVYTQSTEAQVKRANMPPRPEIRPLVLGITFPRDILRKRITKRLRERFKEGMIGEVEALHTAGSSWERLERLGLEYRFIAEFIQGKIKSQDELFSSLNIAIGQFAKRQETWFRGMQKKGVTIEWIPAEHLQSNDIDERYAAVSRYLHERF